MQRLTLVVFILTFILAPTLIHAQDAIPTWLPDPKEIFAEGVEIIEILEEKPQPFVATPILWDDQKREIYVENPDTGERLAYPYLDEFAIVFMSNVLEDGKMLLTVSEHIPHSVNTQIWVWLFDPATKEYTRYKALCGQQPPLYNPNVIEDKWVFYVNPASQEARVCETATGKKSVALPNGLSWTNDPYGISADIAVSPDGKWLAFFGYDPDDLLPYAGFVFSYDIDRDKFYNLGSIGLINDFRISQWLGTTVLVGTSWGTEYSQKDIYIADVRQQNSLEHAVTRGRYWPEYHDDPPRFEFVSGNEGYDGPFHCYWVIYMIETRELTQHDLGTLCEPEIGELGETAYYRDVPDFWTGVATLVRFNALTGKRKDLFIGEIESVEWVSADERYAVMTLDSDGHISTAPRFPVHLWGDPANGRLSYVDLETGKVLFDVPAGWANWVLFWAGSITHWAGPTSSIIPQEEGTLLTITFESTPRMTDADLWPYASSHASLITLVNGDYAETRLIDDAAFWLPSTNRLVVWAEGSESTALGAYDLETRQITPIVKPYSTKEYHIAILDTSSREADLMKVRLSPARGDGRLAVTYTIRLPED